MRGSNWWIILLENSILMLILIVSVCEWMIEEKKKVIVVYMIISKKFVLSSIYVCLKVVIVFVEGESGIKIDCFGKINEKIKLVISNVIELIML